MNQEKLECAYASCEVKPLESSKEGYCIFHAKAADKDEKEFKNAFENYIRKIFEIDLLVEKIEAKYDFRGFIFVGDIHFRRDFKVPILKNAHFEKAEFLGDINFKGIKFLGESHFEVAKFHKDANFKEVEFQREVFFDEVEFWGYAFFMKAKFPRDIYFQPFKKVEFHEGAFFSGVEFPRKTYISPKFMKGKVSFARAILENVSLIGLNLHKNASIDFTDARLRNTEIKREEVEDHIIQEHEENFLKAKEIYLLLKNNFHSLGRYDDESWAFLQEKEMERKNFWCPIKELQVEELGEKWKNRGLKDCFCPVIFYFGRIAKYLWDFWLPTSWKNTKELAFCRTKSFRRPLVCLRAEFKNLVSSMTMNEEEKSRRKVDLSWKEILKALLFYFQSPRYKSARKYFKSTFLKWLYEWGENPWWILRWCIVIIFVFSGLYCLIGDIAIKETIIKSYLEKLYFSGITFTTLGFGGYSPMGGAKVLVFIESFLGIFSIALFVYSFARRTAGR